MTARLDFEALFAALPSPYMVLDSSLTYVAANPAYLRATNSTLDDLIGRKLFDRFPNDDEGGRLLQASLRRVLESGKPDSIALIPYPIPTNGTPTELEMRYWTAAHTPLLDEAGHVAYIVQNTIDVTELHRLKTLAFGGASNLAADEARLVERAEDVQRANDQLIQESNQLRDLFMQAPGFMAVMSGPELTFVVANSTFLDLVGERRLIGKPLAQALPEIEQQGFVDILREVLRTRQPFVANGRAVLLQRTTGAPMEERFVDFVYQPMLDPNGDAWGVFVEGVDITERVRAEQQQKLLIEELNHRVKNALATVQSIAAQTFRTTADPDSFRRAFEARLMALSATHDLLTAENWRGASLRAVIEREFEPYGDERYELDGDAYDLSPPQALALGMMFHELTTNAAKHGALSTSEGCVRVEWRVQNGRLQIAWTERGGPAVAQPSRQGFGSRLIERTLKDEIGGRGGLTFEPAGLVCKMDIPWPASESDIGAGPPKASAVPE